MTAAVERPRCEAIVGYRPGSHRSEPVTCGQVVALRAWTDAAGVTRHACTRSGHAVNVARRFGRDLSALETAADRAYASRYWAAGAAGRR